MRAYAQYKSDGTLWRAGTTIFGLCAAWNHATDPARPLNDSEYQRSNIYARAIKARITRLGYRYGSDYLEFSNGMLWPINRQA